MDEIPSFKSGSKWPRLCPIVTYFCIAYFPLVATYLHDKFEPCSKDVEVCILKIWASSAILDSTFSRFWQFSSFPEATKYHFVKFERICPRAAELELCNRFSNCLTLGAPIGQMDLSELGGPSCMKSVEDESSDASGV